MTHNQNQENKSHSDKCYQTCANFQEPLLHKAIVNHLLIYITGFNLM
jgi:hypothetical protein